MARKCSSKGQLREINALVERLREFVRFNYMTAAEVARQIGVRDSAVYSWLQGCGTFSVLWRILLPSVRRKVQSFGL
jgi:hypothetical protein